jgi:hypothetical protein
MINLRYHIVSLVAVFLALAVGVIAGTTVINDQVVKGLERSDKTLRNALKSQQDENGTLKTSLSVLNTWGAVVARTIEKDQLRGRTVVLLVSSGVDGKTISNLEDALSIAGATRAGVITFSARWNLGDDPTRQQLGQLLGLGQSARASDIAGQGAQRFAARLQSPGDPNSSGDLLRTLTQAGFIQVSDQTGGAFPPAGSIIAWLSSGAANPSPPDGLFSLPLLHALVGHMPVAVGEPMGSADSLSDQIDGDAVLARTVATVDHIDTIPGIASLIAGLHDVSNGEKAPHYGTRRSADTVAPSL